MIIHLHPQRRDKAIAVSVAGDVLLIDDQTFDFSPLADGAVLPLGAAGSDLIVDDVSRKNGEIHVHVLFPIGRFATASACFPAALAVLVDGPIALPDAGFKEVGND